MNRLLHAFYLISFLLFSNIAFAQPTANFTATPLVGCAPLLVQFTSTSTGNPTSYSWNFGNSATSVLQNPSTTYTTPGTYTVSLTVSNSNGSNTKTVNAYITVLGKPIVDFTTPDTAGCPPHTVVFTNNTNPVVPGPATYTWAFGDGFNSTQQNPTHTYTSPGYYNVTLVATNAGGCNASLTKPAYIHVLNPPVADFTANPTSSCDAPATIGFTANVTGTGPFTYSWNFGNGNTGTGANPSHTYTTPGAYTVTMVVTDARGCKDTVVKPNYVGIGNLAPTFTMSPNPGCVGATVTFTNTTLATNSVTWYFGDGSSATSTSSNTASHVYSAPGVYLVKLVVQSGGCTDSATVPLTVHPKPDANFSFTPTQPCPAPALIQFTNTSTGGSTYTWSFGDGGTSTNPNPSHTYAANDWYTVQLVATNSFGCSDTVSYIDTVKVHDLVLAGGAVPYQGCIPLTVNFLTSAYTNVPIPQGGLAYPYGIATWYWDFGNGNTSTLPTPSSVYTIPGIYTVTVTVTTVNGCTQTDTLHVLAGDHPTASFTYVDDTICNNTAVSFVNTSTNATSYIWDFGDGGATGTVNPTYTYTTSGTYTVTLNAYNNGCVDTFQIINLMTVYPPTSKWIEVYDCDTPTLVRFYDTASIEPTSLLWVFGDGTTSTQSNPVHNYPGVGFYTVSLITYNNIYGCSDTLTRTIELFNPVLNMWASDTAICKDETITLSSSYSHISLGYDWKIGNVMLPDTLSSINFTFPVTGWYTVTLYATDLHNCVDSFTRTNYIIVAKPDAQFAASPTVGCIPLNVTFTDQSTDVQGANIVTREWTYGNGNSATVTGATSTQVYNTAGLYDVTLVVTDNIGCKDTLSKPDYIEARQPVAQFIASDTSSCIGTPISFFNTSTGAFLSAQWDFGDNTTSTAFAPTHAYTQTGTYTVRLIVTDPTGCKDTLIRNAYINITKPNASFTMSDTLAICPPLNVQFTNTTIGASYYAWNFGNGGTSSVPSPSNIFTDPGIFNIVMVATDVNGCTDTAFGMANILGYAGGLSYTPLEGCAPLTVDFTATLTNVPSIVWDFSDGTTVPANGSSTISHTYTTPGAYIPKLILSDGAGCLNSSDGLDTIKVDGVLAGFINSPACINTPVLFTDTSYSFFSPVVSWLWNVNNGAVTGTANTISYQYNNTGSYPVTLIATNANGCSDTILKNITINPLPVISAGADTSVCKGDAAVLTGTGGVSYTWAPAAAVSCPTCVTTSATPTATTTFVVTGTDANGCVNNDDVLVTIQTITTSAVDPGGAICDLETFHLRAFGAERYEWKPAASLDNHLIANPIAVPHVTTVYTVLAWEGSCPPDSHKVEVVVWPLPNINAGQDEVIVAGSSVMLNATGSNVSSFLWAPSATLSCETCSNPVASPLETTMYAVTATSSRGCINYDSVLVKVICDKSQLFIPNLFSPNGDGQNDVFYPRGAGLRNITTFRVYNRWGEIVYDRSGIGLNDETVGWNGTHNGKELSPDVYVYVIDGICDSGEPISWKGDITLIR